MPLESAQSKSADLPPFDGEKALSFGLGAASPLWLMFMGAAGAGFAAWSMSRWMKFAVPESFPSNVVKLRLVKPEAAPEAIAETIAAVAFAGEAFAGVLGS